MTTSPDHRTPAVLSFWLPGLGQWYRRRWLRGGAFLAASWTTSGRALAAVGDACATSAGGARFAAWTGLALAVWLWAVHDARRA